MCPKHYNAFNLYAISKFENIYINSKGLRTNNYFHCACVILF